MVKEHEYGKRGGVRVERSVGSEGVYLGCDRRSGDVFDHGFGSCSKGVSSGLYHGEASGRGSGGTSVRTK